jgi:hypothetical protein
VTWSLRSVIIEANLDEGLFDTAAAIDGTTPATGMARRERLVNEVTAVASCPASDATVGCLHRVAKVHLGQLMVKIAHAARLDHRR